MLLENNYYQVESGEISCGNGHFHLRLLPDCEVYRAHFPGHPVCPGVCNIETIRECAMRLLGKQLVIRLIRRCRLTAVASPAICPELDLFIDACLENGDWLIEARMEDHEKLYVSFKGIMAETGEKA